MAFLGALGGLGSVVSALGTGLGVISAISMGNYQAKVAEQNAQIAEENAARARERAAIEAQDNDALTLAMLGQQEAAQASSGIDLGSRSAVLTRKQARRLGRRDTLNIVYAGALEGYNNQLEAMNMRTAGQGAKAQGYANALGTFLSGAGNLLGNAQTTAQSSKYDPWITKSGTNLRRVG